MKLNSTKKKFQESTFFYSNKQLRIRRPKAQKLELLNKSYIKV